MMAMYQEGAYERLCRYGSKSFYHCSISSATSHLCVCIEDGKLSLPFAFCANDFFLHDLNRFQIVMPAVFSIQFRIYMKFSYFIMLHLH